MLARKLIDFVAPHMNNNPHITLGGSVGIYFMKNELDKQNSTDVDLFYVSDIQKTKFYESVKNSKSFEIKNLGRRGYHKDIIVVGKNEHKFKILESEWKILIDEFGNKYNLNFTKLDELTSVKVFDYKEYKIGISLAEDVIYCKQVHAQLKSLESSLI